MPYSQPHSGTVKHSLMNLNLRSATCPKAPIRDNGMIRLIFHGIPCARQRHSSLIFVDARKLKPAQLHAYFLDPAPSLEAPRIRQKPSSICQLYSSNQALPCRRLPPHPRKISLPRPKLASQRPAVVSCSGHCPSKRLPTTT